MRSNQIWPKPHYPLNLRLRVLSIMSVPLPGCTAACLCICLSVPLHVSAAACRCRCLAVSLPVCLAACLCLCLSVPLPVCTAVWLCLCLSVSLPVSVSAYLSVSVPLTVCTKPRVSVGPRALIALQVQINPHSITFSCFDPIPLIKCDA